MAYQIRLPDENQPPVEQPAERAIDWTPDTTRAHDVTEPLAGDSDAWTDYATGWDLRRVHPLNPGSTRVRVKEPLFPLDRARIAPDGQGGYEARKVT